MDKFEALLNSLSLEDTLILMAFLSNRAVVLESLRTKEPSVPKVIPIRKTKLII